MMAFAYCIENAFEIAVNKGYLVIITDAAGSDKNDGVLGSHNYVGCLQSVADVWTTLNPDLKNWEGTTQVCLIL
jgi:hypothetical protein